MNAAELRNRTKQYALRIMKVVEALPTSIRGRVVADQLMRSGTSVGANYRAVCRARSRKEFIAKLGVVIEEGDESAFWLEVTIESGLLSERRLGPLLKEADELVAIMTAARKTAERRAARPKSKG
jgi:four helix bundle protein